MLLKIVTGKLREVYKKIVPGTMLHVDQLMNERRTNKELCSQSFYTADGVIYFLNGARKVPVLVMTREVHNPLLKKNNGDFAQFAVKENYPVLQSDFEQALIVPDTVLITLPNLRLRKNKTEWCYLAIGTTSAEYTRLNSEERKLAERVYGQGKDFTQNMKMFKDSKISETRIYVLNPAYVRKHARDGAIARIPWLNSFNGNSFFSASDRDISLPNSVCGHVTRAKRPRRSQSVCAK